MAKKSWRERALDFTTGFLKKPTHPNYVPRKGLQVFGGIVTTALYGASIIPVGIQSFITAGIRNKSLKRAWLHAKYDMTLLSVGAARELSNTLVSIPLTISPILPKKAKNNLNRWAIEATINNHDRINRLVEDIINEGKRQSLDANPVLDAISLTGNIISRYAGTDELKHKSDYCSRPVNKSGKKSNDRGRMQRVIDEEALVYFNDYTFKNPLIKEAFNGLKSKARLTGQATKRERIVLNTLLEIDQHYDLIADTEERAQLDKQLNELAEIPTEVVNFRPDNPKSGAQATQRFCKRLDHIVKDSQSVVARAVEKAKAYQSDELSRKPGASQHISENPEMLDIPQRPKDDSAKRSFMAGVKPSQANKQRSNGLGQHRVESKAAEPSHPQPVQRRRTITIGHKPKTKERAPQHQSTEQTVESRKARRKSI